MRTCVANQAAAELLPGSWLSFAMPGYQFSKVERREPSRVCVLVCSERCAPVRLHCICCFLAKRLLMTAFTVASTKAEDIRSPDQLRSHGLLAVGQSVTEPVLLNRGFRLNEALGFPPALERFIASRNR